MTVSVCTVGCRVFKQHPTLTPNARVSPAGAAVSVREVPCRQKHATTHYCLLQVQCMRQGPTQRYFEP